MSMEASKFSLIKSWEDEGNLEWIREREEEEELLMGVGDGIGVYLVF